MAKAVGPEGFANDAGEIMNLLVGVQKNGLEDDDPQFRYLVQAMVAICECMVRTLV